MKTLEVKAITSNWEEVLDLCKSRNVVYRGLVNGYPAYAPKWDSTWCIVYTPKYIR